MLAARITRIWLRGPRAGRREAFAENLPGHPDNLSLDPDGFFWVALVGDRSRAYERFTPYPALRRTATRIPGLRVPHPMPWLRAHQYAGCVVAADTAGNILASLHDPARRYGAITSVNRYGRDVFVGSIAMPSVARISWPDVKLRHGPDNRR
jgi:hypothetical protein